MLEVLTAGCDVVFVRALTGSSPGPETGVGRQFPMLTLVLSSAFNGLLFFDDQRTPDGQVGLVHEGCDQRFAALCGPELGAQQGAEFGEVPGTEDS